MARIDGTIEWLVDESTGQVVGQKRPDGVEVGIATTQTDPLTGGMELSFGEDQIASDVLVVDKNITINKKIRGAVIQFWPGKVLTLGSRGKLIDCYWDFSRITSSAQCPNQFISVAGTGIKISGCKEKVGLGLPYPFVFNSTSVGRFIGITGDCDDLVIKNNDILNGFYGIYANGVTLNKLRISKNKILGARNGILLNNILGDDHAIEHNDFPATSHTVPISSVGEIHVFYGFPQLTSGALTNDVYENRHGKNIRIVGNVMKATSHRAIYVVNGVGVKVRDNDVNSLAIPGDDTGPGASDDCIVLELCRSVTVSGNFVHCSGENGFDFLGCKDVTITGNTATKCDVVACMFDWSDSVIAGYSTGFKALYHMPERITSVGNSWDAGDAAIAVRGGKHIKCADNIGKFIGYRTATSNIDVLVSCNSTYTSKALGTWPEDLDFSGCTKERVESALVSAVVGTDTIQFSEDPGIQTGNRLTLWLETPATGTMPTGIDDITDYYAIRTDALNYKLATSRANARAGTAITWSGTLTGNLYVSELQAGNVYVGATPANDLRGFKLSRDLADVSPLISVAANTNYAYTFSAVKGTRDAGNIKFGYLVRDAATSFGASSNLAVPRHFEFQSGFITDTSTRGVCVQWADRAQVKFRTGAYLLPVPNSGVASGSGSGVQSVNSGYIRAIVQ